MAAFQAVSLGADTACRRPSLIAWSEARRWSWPETIAAFGVVSSVAALVLLPETMVVVRPAVASGARSAWRSVLSPAQPIPLSV